MYLHVGNNKNIRKKDIIGIFDMDNATVSMITRKFLSSSQKRGLVESANDEIPKSFVIYECDGKNERLLLPAIKHSTVWTNGDSLIGMGIAGEVENFLKKVFALPPHPSPFLKTLKIW